MGGRRQWGLFILFGGRNRSNIKGPTAGSHTGMFPINHAVVMDGVWQELHAVSTGMITPARGSVRFILFKTQVLPQGSSGTGQFLDWTDGYAAGLSKQDVLLTACRFSVMFSRSSLWQWVKATTWILPQECSCAQLTMCCSKFHSGDQNVSFQRTCTR